MDLDKLAFPKNTSSAVLRATGKNFIWLSNGREVVGVPAADGFDLRPKTASIVGVLRASGVFET